MRKYPNSHREAKATAPVLDSTRHYENNRRELRSRSGNRESQALVRFRVNAWLWFYKWDLRGQL
jgi:hypothetical protein